MTTLIEIGTMEQASAEKVKEALHGKSFMEFEVLICPHPGGPNVCVQTEHDADETEIKDFIMWCLATSL